MMVRRPLGLGPAHGGHHSPARSPAPATDSLGTQPAAETRAGKLETLHSIR